MRTVPQRPSVRHELFELDRFGGRYRSLTPADVRFQLPHRFRWALS